MPTTHGKGTSLCKMLAMDDVTCHDVDPLFAEQGKDIFAMTSAESINNFVEEDRSTVVCFRCGEKGHLRYQCLTFKVRKCFRYEQGSCASSSAGCTFAHGNAELRKPWLQKCVRVVKQKGKFICLGCHSSSHTFRKCPLNKGIIFL